MRTLATVALFACACSSSPEPPPPAVAPDVTEDSVTEAPPPKLLDTAPPAPQSLVNLCDEPTPEPKAWPADATKFSLSVYHYNIQYVAGGLDNFLETWTATEQEVEDAIIVESFEPVVALYERHPDWGGGFEMQGYMLEVLAQRHPDLARRFHKLVRRGQVDLMSFHWSDQLVTTYTKVDMEWSWAENKRLFDALCMPRATVHFLQEGQYGPGISAFATDKEKGTLVLPRNLFGLYHDPKPQGLLMLNDGHPVVTTNGFSQDGIELSWSFVDDGELVATGKMNPYLWSTFKHDPVKFKEYEDKLQAEADAGWTIAPISVYLKALAAKGVQPVEIVPPVLDGSWQPKDSANMSLWMGGKGQAPGDERDQQILTGNVRARHTLRAVERLIDLAAAAGIDTASAEAWHRIAIRELLLAEVSDATGWRPIVTEIAYGLRHQAEAMRLGDAIGGELLTLLGHTEAVGVDSVTGELKAPPVAEPGTTMPSPPPALAAVTLVTERPHTLAWASHGAEYVELTITLPATGDTTSGTSSPPPVRLEVPLFEDAITYSPALIEDTVRTFPLSAYAFVKSGQPAGLPLPNGLLGLGPTWTMVLDLSTMDLAARLSPGKAVFEDLTFPAQDAAEWHVRFYPVAAASALTAANRLNVGPVVVWPAR